MEKSIDGSESTTTINKDETSNTEKEPEVEPLKVLKPKKVKGLRPTKGSKLKQAKDNGGKLSTSTIKKSKKDADNNIHKLDTETEKIANTQNNSRPKKDRKKNLHLDIQAQPDQHPDLDEETKVDTSPDLSKKGSPTKKRNNEFLYCLKENQECLGKFFLYKDNAFVANPEAQRPNNQSTPKAQREIALAIQGLDNLSEKELEFCKRVLIEGLSYPLKENQIHMCHIISVDYLEKVLIRFANTFLEPLSQEKIKEILDSAHEFFEKIFLDESIIEEAKDLMSIEKLNKIFEQHEQIIESISTCLMWIAKSINIVERLKALDYIYNIFESAPKNLRPGDASTNSSIQEDLDPYLYEKQDTKEIVEREHSICIRESFNKWRAALGLEAVEVIVKNDQVMSSSNPLLRSGRGRENISTLKTELT